MTNYKFVMYRIEVTNLDHRAGQMYFGQDNLAIGIRYQVSGFRY
jgi:hypothetical protein